MSLYPDKGIEEESSSVARTSLDDMFEHVLECVSRLDKNNHFLNVNEAYAGKFGYSKEEMVGMPFYETIHPNDKEFVETKFQQLFTDGRVEVEIRGLKKDKSTFYQQFVLVKGLESTSSSVHHYCFMKDITDRVLNEHQLMDSIKSGLHSQEQQFRNLVKNVPGVVFRCSTHDYWSFEYLNETIEKITGFQLNDILHGVKSFRDLVHPEDIDRVKSAIDLAISKKNMYVVDYRIIDNNEQERWVRERAACTLDETGKVRWLDGFIRDIHEERNTEKRLKLSSALIENSINAAIWFTKDGEIVHANSATSELLGYTNAELSSVSLFDIFLGTSPHKRNEFLDLLRKEKNQTKKYEMTIITRDGEQIPVEVITSYLDIDGEVFTCCSMQDISQRIQAQLFEKIANSSNDMVAFINHNYIYKVVNHAYASAFGLSREEVIGKTFGDIMGRERFSQLVKPKLDQCFSGRHIEFKKWVELPDKGNRYCHIKYDPLVENETVTGVVLVLRDLTQVLETEEALQVSEEKFLKAFETSPDMMLLTTFDEGKLISINSAFTETTGFSFDNIGGKPVTESFLDVDVRKEFIRLLEQDGCCENFEAYITTKDGEQIPVLTSANLIDLHGKRCIFTIIRDVSERKDAERLIYESHQKFEELIDDINVIVWEASLPGLGFTFVSEPAERILGFPQTDWYQDEFWLDHIHPDDKEYAYSFCMTATREGRDHQLEYRMFDKLGKEVWIKDIVHVVRNEDGEAVKLRGVMLDVTERKNNDIAERSKNRALSVLSMCNDAVAKIRDRDELLQSICDIISDVDGYNFAYIAYAEEGKTTKPSSFSSSDNAFLASLVAQDDSLESNTPVSEAITSGERCVIEIIDDVAGEEDWKRTAIRKGYRSLIILPLKANYETFAVLVIVSSEIQAFADEESSLLDNLVENLTFGLQSIHETEKRRRAEALLALENQVFQLVATSPSFDKLLDELVRHIETNLDSTYCSILLLSEDGLHLHHGAAPSLPAEYNDAVNGIEVGPNVGSCGTAAYYNTIVSVPDISIDPLWDDFRELALSHDLKACHSTPVRDSNGNVIATFANYYKTVRSPSPEEQDIIDRMTHIISGAIERRNALEAIRKREERFTMAMRGAQDGLWDWDVVAGDLYMSPRWIEMIGYSSDELKPHIDTFFSLVCPRDLDRVEKAVEEFLEGQTSKYEIELKLRHKDGHFVEVLSRAFGLKDSDNNFVRMVGTHVDITERKKTELLIQENEKRFRSLYDDTPSMFFTLDKNGNILSVNRFGATHLGFSVEELVDKPILDITDASDIPILQASISACISGPEKLHHCEFRQLHKYGEIIWVRATLRLLGENGTSSILISCEDISETKILSQQLEYQAKHDSLTGLINRAEFERRLRRILSADVPEGEHALCYLDLDQFKVINDTCGHLAGDELLRRISYLLSTVVRKRDTLARLGGDEFAVLLEHCPMEQAKRVANELLDAIQSLSFVWEGKRFNVGVSIGLVPMQGDEGNLSDMLSAADEACYAAKDAGRNRVHIYHPDDVELSKRRGEMQWVGEINRALEEDSFCLAVQPMMYLGGDTDVQIQSHCEFLLRMRDEENNIIMPGAFLPAAERYNLSPKLDRWVVENAFGWLLSHPEKTENLNCSINLSGLSLGEADFLDFLLAQFEHGGISPEKICFEITETAAIANLGNAIKFINALKEIGCFFALDDFGAGLSSFTYLKNLPVDYLKIDGSFVRDILKDPIDFAMVRSINEVGQVMGKKTIAEFVENDETLEALKEIGVDFAQGYGIGKPELL